MKNVFLISGLIALTSIFMMGLWAIDTGVSASIVSAQTGLTTSAMGLFGIRNPIIHYHIGLVITLFSFIMLVLILVKKVIDND